jgi:shikimate kinase
MWTTFVGFMGSGKTTVVRHMQRATGRVACDLDVEIERRGGLTVPEVFAREGEEGFRRRELAALRDLESAPALLLATGGGIVETPVAVDLVRQRGVVIWLDAPWEVLRARLEETPRQERPLLAQQGWEGLRRLHARRLPLYAAAADFRLRTDRLQPEDAAQTALLRGLIWRRRLERAPA